MPGTRSFISSTSVRSRGLGRSSRGSRPGFCSSRIISRRVRMPTSSSRDRVREPTSATFSPRAARQPPRISSEVKPKRDSRALAMA